MQIAIEAAAIAAQNPAIVKGVTVETALALMGMAYGEYVDPPHALGSPEMTALIGRVATLFASQKVDRYWAGVALGCWPADTRDCEWLMEAAENTDDRLLWEMWMELRGGGDGLEAETAEWLVDLFEKASDWTMNVLKTECAGKAPAIG